jgi:hypothetical protein
MAGGYEETLKRLPRRGYHEAVPLDPELPLEIAQEVIDVF